MMTTNAHIRTSISSAVRGGRWGSRGLAGLFSSASNRSFNLFLQNRGYKIFGAGLGEQATRLLAFVFLEVIWVLACIPVVVFTTGY
jgi:hypothetical protein